ncbi:hypothetical protein SAMD00023378_1362 [Ralstonia sp. NT80]|nr:hypothetical protein C404_17050 [Ralstonia sp. AU12-08]GAQ27679.1 hypothetical protein SAMD00023378_1362 [Ralstonia sp. NT80]
MATPRALPFVATDDGRSTPVAARGLPAKSSYHARLVESEGGRAAAIEANSTDPEAISRAVAQAVERFGAISVVVVNAGILTMRTIDAVSLEELDRMRDINVRGVFLSIQATAPIW